MPSDDNKNYSVSLSSQMILGLLVTFLPLIGGAAYSGIKFWGKMEKTIEAVDKFKPYDDTEFREKVQAFEIEVKALKERQLGLAEQAVRVAEKASDAIALSRETKAVAQGAATESAASSREVRAAVDSQAREVQTKLAALKQDLDATAAALRAEMNTLKRATSNPLSTK
jgi:ABC-type phosphate transport system auxiliary subunit